MTCVQFDDTRVISGAVDRLIKIWNLETGQVWICTVNIACFTVPLVFENY